LAAYRAGWAAFEHALADANPEDPELPATMVDPQLQQVKGNLLADQEQGMVGRGTFTLHPKVTALSATSATVVDCAYSTAALVYQASGKPVPPVTPPENDGGDVHARAVWRDVEGVLCAAVDYARGGDRQVVGGRIWPAVCGIIRASEASEKCEQRVGGSIATRLDA
jgi:hypothetical protein